MSLIWLLQKLLAVRACMCICLCMRSKWIWYCEQDLLLGLSSEVAWMVHAGSLISTGKESSTGVQGGTFILPIDDLSSVENKSIKARGLYMFSLCHVLAPDDTAVMLLIQMSWPRIPLCRRTQCPRLMSEPGEPCLHFSKMLNYYFSHTSQRLIHSTAVKSLQIFKGNLRRT